MCKPSQLRDFPEDWHRCLVITAHPDDVEYPSAAPIAKWTSRGKEVVYLFATRGEAGMDGVPPEEARAIRTEEQRLAAAAVGVSRIYYLDYTDGVLVQSLQLRHDIASVIREVQPDCVIVGGYRERIGNGKLNMSDHRALGICAVDAVRDASNRWVFTDIEASAWSGVKHVAQHGSPSPTHVVDCFDFFEDSVSSLLCHHRYLSELGTDESDVRSMLDGHHQTISELFGSVPGIGLEMVDGPEA